MRYGFYSTFKPLCVALTHGNKIVHIELETVHQYQDDESLDIFHVIGYSCDTNEYLRKFIELNGRIEINDKNFEVKVANILRRNGFEPLF